MGSGCKGVGVYVGMGKEPTPPDSTLGEGMKKSKQICRMEIPCKFCEDMLELETFMQIPLGEVRYISCDCGAQIQVYRFEYKDAISIDFIEKEDENKT